MFMFFAEDDSTGTALGLSTKSSSPVGAVFITPPP